LRTNIRKALILNSDWPFTLSPGSCQDHYSATDRTEGADECDNRCSLKAQQASFFGNQAGAIGRPTLKFKVIFLQQTS
jgi:hypothetical protein